MGDSEQPSLLPSGILYLGSASGNVQRISALQMPDRCDLLVAETAAEAVELLHDRRLLVILFDMGSAAEEWESLARAYASPDCEVPVPLVWIGDYVPEPDDLEHMAALGVVDWVVGEQAASLLDSKLRGLVRLQRQNERVGRQARNLVESEADLEILVHQQRAANLQLQNEVQQRRRVLAALAISESRLRSMVEASGDSVWEVNTDARYSYASPNIELILGVPAEEVVGNPLSQYLTGEAATRVHRAFVDLLRSNEPLVRFENSFAGADGRVRVLETSVVPVTSVDGGVIGFRGVDRDITRIKEQQAELEQARRSESLGKLTGGITHDLNNLLTIVLGNLRLLRREVDDDDGEGMELVEDTESAAGEAVDLVRQLSGKTSRKPLKNEMLELNEQVSEATRLIRRSIGPGVEIMLELTPDSPVVALDSSRLHNALLNLALNSRDAMASKGRLMLETLTAKFDANNLPEETRLKPGAYAIVRVMDTGSGMTADVRARATEAFFTTKEAGKGSGMGLSMVFGMVVKAGGAMRLDSEPGEGTTVTLWLPLQNAEQLQAPVAGGDDTPVLAEPAERSPASVLVVDNSSPPELEGGDETLLVVDDDPRIRRLTVRFLKELGYTVIEAADGSEAKQILEGDQGREIDLLFTDIVMPGDLDGVSLGHWVLDHLGGVRVLLSSGFGNEGDGHGMDTGSLAFLPKPFAQRALAQAVRKVLDQG